MKSLRLVFAILLLSAVGSVLADGVKQLCSGKYFYLTPDIWMGWEVHEACADGYHFASALELLQVSNLTYNTQLGSIALDSGHGPPAGDFGWLRTGSAWWPGPGPSPDNCRNWTSSDIEDFGMVGFLFVDFGYANGNSWNYGKEQCIDGARVWCVSNPVFPK